MVTFATRTNRGAGHQARPLDDTPRGLHHNSAPRWLAIFASVGAGADYERECLSKALQRLRRAGFLRVLLDRG